MGQSAARKFLEAQNLNIDSKRFSRKQNVLPDNVFLFETLHVTPAAEIQGWAYNLARQKTKALV